MTTLWPPTADAPPDLWTGIVHTVVVRQEAFLVLARNGYRPGLVVGVAVGTGVAAGAFAVPVVVLSFARWWKAKLGGGVHKV